MRAVAFLGLNLADYGLTRASLPYGGQELNPLMRWAIDREWLFLVLKMGLPLLVMVLLFGLSPHLPQRGRRVVTYLMIGMFAIVLWNTASLLSWRFA